MSYQVVGGPGARRRPGVVAAASILLYLSAALIAVLGVLSMVNALTNSAALQTTLPNNAELPSGFFQGVAIVTLVIYVLFGAGFVALAVLVGRGRNPARIVAWVAAGIFALCCGCSQVLSAAGQSLPSAVNADPNAIRTTITEPAWFTIGSAVVGIALVLALLAVIVLLAVPAANDFFRKGDEIPQSLPWPNLYGAGSAYPQPPAVPQYPNLPPYGQFQSQPQDQPYPRPAVPPVPEPPASDPPTSEPPASEPPAPEPPAAPAPPPGPDRL